ncbi:hypothetical protein ACS78V_20890 [Yersinia enterocolitica]|uniref:hypothetical protein n=1 Tax=Yersinia enterocolitica TaxID=630 RepID=UPI0005E12229|nr:hypothetical protein [Yersinia enterocolitica]EKN6098079.1 hypothetical protein [Yersinia enterocolitica]ELZ1905136.1 hypothetical protein [Yersinia enterocolitica]CQR18769.1 Uncharacterised protein [Yersinia enterocolitica]CRX56225.1 Uncharacterised protein [Yersinia enterocolitica]HDZ9658225.1 hypothetical protein [Yersinia enterocolitica]
MPPDLIATYNKDLRIAPIGTKEHLETFHFFTREAGLFRADEYLVTGGDYHYYLDVYCLGCTTQDFYVEYGSELDDQNIPQQDLVNTLLEQDMEDEMTTTLIGRIAYKDFNFTENDGRVLTAKQIKSAVIDNDFRGAGLASHIYRMLTDKHEYLVCDNMQSLAGGSLWASSIVSIAEVRIYDIQSNAFIDTLGKGGIGHSGVIPWSCQTLTIEQIEEWGRSFNPKACHHIVNIISRDNLYL